jgi:hypothetical protein
VPTQRLGLCSMVMNADQEWHCTCSQSCNCSSHIPMSGRVGWMNTVIAIRTCRVLIQELVSDAGLPLQSIADPLANCSNQPQRH